MTAAELTKEIIQENMQSNMTWLTRGILAIYERQTSDEKEAEHTKYFNGRGFTGADARFLSSLAKWILNGRKLTEKQAYVARKRMMKYAGQLLIVAREKAARQG